MATLGEIAQIADRFGMIADQFCSIVDSASNLDRTELLGKLYRILPLLIGEAIGLPDVQPSDNDEQIENSEWKQVHNLLKEKLGDWDLYHQVFDPTEDDEAIFGSLVNDIAEIYSDLKEGLASVTRNALPGDAIWEWRFSFYTHWGRHAMEALLTMHFRLQ
jgi:hypothetical protein